MERTLLNKKFDGAQLFEINFTPKGKKETVMLLVYASNKLNASNYLIRNKIYGKQNSVKYSNVNLLK